MFRATIRSRLSFGYSRACFPRTAPVIAPRKFASSPIQMASKAPPLPAGRDKHHIVVLEAVHAPMPKFDFPHDITLHPRTYKGDVAERIKDATIVIACVTPVTPEDLDIAKDVRCLAVMAVGISWVDREAFAERGVTVTNCAGGNVEAVCEHFLGLYFALRKKIVEIDNAMKGTKEWIQDGTLIAHWPEKKPPPGCRQEVLGIFGYGTIGKRIAVLAKALGFSEVLVADRKGTSAEQLRPGRTSFEEVVKRSSTIVICVPKSDDTVSMISEHEFGLMRKDAIVINVARGGIVNEADFARALKTGQIAGGAVDVLETEPGGIGTTPLCPDPSKGEEPIPNLIISEYKRLERRELVVLMSNSTASGLVHTRYHRELSTIAQRRSREVGHRITRRRRRDQSHGLRPCWQDLSVIRTSTLPERLQIIRRTWKDISPRDVPLRVRSLCRLLASTSDRGLEINLRD